MNLLSKPHTRRLAALLVADALVFSTTNATKTASFMVIIGFGLLMLTFYYLIYGLLGFSGYYGLKIRNKKSLARLISLITGVLVALQSVGQLGSRDILVLLPLVVIAYFYGVYAKKASV